MNPEDRLRSAMEERAAAARTSPDALDGVFTRVSRHRRNVRVAAAAGSALSVVAVAVVATTALRAPGETGVVPASPSPTLAAPSVGASASATTTVVMPAPDRALVVDGRNRVTEVSTTTGERIRSVEAPGLRAESEGIAWSRDRRTLYYVAGSCDVVARDVETGSSRSLGKGGSRPALSPDGTKLALTACGGGDDEIVTVLATDGSGVVVTIRRDKVPTPQPSDFDFFAAYAAHQDLAWADDDTLVVARHYEGAMEPLVLDIRTDRTVSDGDSPPDTALDSVTDDGRGGLYGAAACCYPEFEKPTTVYRVSTDAEARPLFTHPGGVGDMAFDRRGTLLFVDATGLWRYDRARGKAVLLVRGATAVAS